MLTGLPLFFRDQGFGVYGGPVILQNQLAQIYQGRREGMDESARFRVGARADKRDGRVGITACGKSNAD